MEDVIYMAAIEGQVHIVLDELETRVVFEVSDVARGAGDEIVHANDLVTAGQQGVTQMRADEARTACD
jgi:hypothetical protein